MPSQYPAGSATIAGSLTISSITSASATNVVAVTPTGGAAQAVTAASATFTVNTNTIGNSVYSATALSTTVVQVTNAAASFCGGHFLNLNSVPVTLAVFAVSATTDVTLGTTAPKCVVGIPANSTGTLGLAYFGELTTGVACAKGICIAAVTGGALGTSGPTTALMGFVEYRPT